MSIIFYAIDRLFRNKSCVHLRYLIKFSDKCLGITLFYLSGHQALTRLLEHGTRNNQLRFQHLSQCEPFHEYVNFFTIDASNLVDTKEHIEKSILYNYFIVDYNRNWSQLLYLEAYYVKKLSPFINKGLKASRELQLFS